MTRYSKTLDIDGDYVRRLRSVITYNPNTGKFHWTQNRGGYAVAGSEAGYTSDQGRIKIQVFGKEHSASRLAWLYMTGRLPEHEIDHINRDCADNRWTNLRQATRSENTCNRSTVVNNTSGVTGVRRIGRRWRAEIWKNRRRYHLGYFSSKDGASQAYINAAKELHGEFAAVGKLS